MLPPLLAALCLGTVCAGEGGGPEPGTTEPPAKEPLPTALPLVGEFPHHFEPNSSLPAWPTGAPAEARHSGPGATDRAAQVALKAEEAEAAQHPAAARAALVAAYRLAEEAQQAAEEVGYWVAG
jgi:hypothetical protein